MLNHTRKTALAALGAATLLTTAACGGGGSSAQGSEGISDEVKLAAVHDQTGPVAYAGVGANKGAELAIDEINSEGFLGDGVEITMETTDTAGEIDRAVSEMSKAMSDQEVSAILGPTMGQQAAAVAPSVNQQQVPTVFTQAGSEGVVTGDYTFRATAPMETYYDVAMDWLDQSKHQDVAVVYNATYPTFSGLGEDVVPSLAEERDVEITQSLKAQDTTQDFTNQAQTIASSKPDAVVMLLTAPQSVTFLSQVRQAGYEGQVVGTSVQAAGNIAEAGKAAEGLVYPVPFSTALEQEASQEFATAFEEEYGEQADVYAAEGYDAVWWIARAIEASGDSSREGIQEGLAQVAEDGFTGAQGELTFDGNDARVPGAMVRWAEGEETLVD